jgi:hypothetical protein
LKRVISLVSRGGVTAVVSASLVLLAAFVVPQEATAATALNSSFTWQLIGPKPIVGEESEYQTHGGTPFGPAFTATGRVTDMAFDASMTPVRIILATANGGVWVSDDDGASFQPISNTLPSLAIGSVRIDTTTTPYTIWAATGEGNNCFDCYYGLGVFKTLSVKPSSAAQSWTEVPDPNGPQGHLFNTLAATKLQFDGGHRNASGALQPILYLGTAVAVSSSRNEAQMIETADFTKVGIWRSMDRGASWQQLSGAFPKGAEVDDIAFDFPAPTNRIYAAVHSLGVFGSNDNGTTWTLLLGPGPSIGSPHPATAGRISLAVSSVDDAAVD